MTSGERRKHAAEWAERTATEQGLPAKVTDPSVLRDIARLVGLHERKESKEDSKAK